MLGLIRFRYRLRRLERQLADVHKTYEKQKAAAKARGASEEELEALSAANSTDDLYFTEALLAAHTSRLIKMAHDLMIPVPYSWETAHKDKWVQGAMHRYMTTEGMTELRAAIRAEQKARRELIVMWTPLVSALVGLIGAITGLAAVLGRH